MVVNEKKNKKINRKIKNNKKKVSKKIREKKLKTKIFCKDTKETVYSYRAYLLTKHWDMKRKKILKRDKYKCRLCGTEGELLNVHHKTYRNIGDERNYELITLCGYCHIIVHKEKRKYKEFFI